jgi:hypothetical protein
MVGRTRKKGRREPNGRIARTYVNPKAQVAEQPHRMTVHSQYREWPEAETHFGRLMLNRKITPAQYEAGSRYSILAGLYRLYYGIPSPNPRAIDLLRSMGGYEGMAPDMPKALKRDYDDAFCACGNAGNRAQRAVNAHAVFDRVVPDMETLTLLICGLDKLVVHFGLDAKMQITASRK